MNEKNQKIKKHNFLFSGIAISCLLLSIGELFGSPVRVSLFNNSQIRSVVISAWNGQLVVSSADSFQYSIAHGKAIHATLCNGRIWLISENEQIGSFEQITVKSSDSLAVVRLRPVSPQIEARNYEELIIMSVDVDKILIINQIDKELYIAGVIEAETGQRQTAEFYKAKAIICRTYLYRAINRHQNEGFHLCDEVHCQAYKGQCQNRSTIFSAVLATDNIIIVDSKESKPILAVYHSNCGGQTELSQNVWQSSLPYLVSATDDYCTFSPNARWQRTISLNEWNAYLSRNGFRPNPNVDADFSFQQTRRTQNYKVNNFTIPVQKIRADWQLRSTFFSISVVNDNVVLDGRGYGHGVGLCQEGAMEMGRRGFKYDEIINHYFKNVNLKKAEPLNF